MSFVCVLSKAYIDGMNVTANVSLLCGVGLTSGHWCCVCVGIHVQAYTMPVH